MKLTTESLARSSSRRPWTTIILWILVIGAAGFISSRFLADALTTDAQFTNKPEAQQAAELVEKRFGDEGISEVFIVTSSDGSATDPGFEAGVRAVQEAASAQTDVRSALTFYDTQDPSMVSEDGHTTLVPVNFRDTDAVSDHYDAVTDILAAGNAQPGL
jgi:trehalose monomycolate/heme transporter